MAAPQEGFKAGNHPDGIQRFVPASSDRPKKKRGKEKVRTSLPVTIIAIHPGDQEILSTSRKLKRVR